MNCQNHPEVPATAYCRSCGKPVCDECRRDAYGTVFCAEHAPAPAAASTPANASAPPSGQAAGSDSAAFNSGAAPGPGFTAGFVVNDRVYPFSDVSPGLALFLGLIPGVGAIYNGQYAKGLVHAIIWGILMSIANSRAVHGMEPLFVMLVLAWWAYMAFEAYHTARKRRLGEPVDEYSSLIDMRGRSSQVPVAAISLIILGILLLLHTLDLLDFEVIARYWPVLLIAAGVYLLYGRFANSGSGGGAA